MDPTSYKLNTFNLMGTKLSELKKKEQDFYCRVDSIGAEMRETVGLVAEIAEVKLQLINQLLAFPEQNRNIREAENCFQIEINRVIQENLECYQTLLDAREYSMEAGQSVKLTKEKKRALTTSFASLINGKVQGINLGIDTSTDLCLLKNSTEKELETQLSIFRTLLDAKTSITMQFEKTANQTSKIKTLQSELNSGEPKDIWEAGERGDIEFIQKGIDDCFFWQVEDFVNQKNADGQTALSLASTHGHNDCVKLLLKNKANPNTADKLGYRPLHWAAKKGHLKIGVELVQNEAIIDCQGEFERTPLHMAAYNGHDEFVVFLLQKGANINAQTDAKAGGLSALHKAMMNEHVLVITELVKNPQLDANLLDSKGHSPMYYAIITGRSDIAALIVAHLNFEWPTDPANPNHISQLLKIIPDKNPEQIKKFLERFMK
jgi:hypothetical protein